MILRRKVRQKKANGCKFWGIGLLVYWFIRLLGRNSI